MRLANSFVMRSSESPRTKAARERLHQLTQVSLSLSAQMRDENSLPTHGVASIFSTVCGSILANVLATFGLLADSVHRAIVGVHVALLQVGAQHIALRAEQLHHTQLNLRLQCL